MDLVENIFKLYLLIDIGWANYGGMEVGCEIEESF